MVPGPLLYGGSYTCWTPGNSVPISATGFRISKKGSFLVNPFKSRYKKTGQIGQKFQWKQGGIKRG
jgi:hypothetical protein